MRQRNHSSPLLFNMVLKILDRTIRRGKLKEVQVEKVQRKLSVFAIEMILYLEYTKNSTRKFLVLIIEAKLAG